MIKVLILVHFAVFFPASALAGDPNGGRVIYDRSCKTCHGVDGVANPSIARSLKVEIKDLKSPDVMSRSGPDLRRIITEGKGKMEPVKSNSGEAAR